MFVDESRGTELDVALWGEGLVEPLLVVVVPLGVRVVNTSDVDDDIQPFQHLGISAPNHSGPVVPLRELSKQHAAHRVVRVEHSAVSADGLLAELFLDVHGE